MKQSLDTFETSRIDLVRMFTEALAKYTVRLLTSTLVYYYPTVEVTIHKLIQVSTDQLTYNRCTCYLGK